MKDMDNIVKHAESLGKHLIELMDKDQDDWFVPDMLNILCLFVASATKASRLSCTPIIPSKEEILKGALGCLEHHLRTALELEAATVST